MLFLQFVALMIVSLVEQKIHSNMKIEQIGKLPVLPKGVNSKKPTYDNIRYFFRNIYLCEMVRDGVLVNIGVKGMTNLYKEINQLFEVYATGYSNFENAWWRFGHT